MSALVHAARILVVDDAQDTLEVIQRHLASKEYQIFTALDVSAAVQLLDKQAVDLVITDLKMPGASGLELIRHIRANYKDVEIIMITGYASVEGAVQAVKLGAEEYLPKPFTKEELFAAVERSLDKLRLHWMGKTSTEQSKWASLGLLGESDKMQKVFASILKAGSSNKPVLILGEPGTGRELVARAIHLTSPRVNSLFLNVNCENLGDQYLNDLFFGEAPLFQSVAGGSIYLSEIGFTSLSIQTQLERVLSPNNHHHKPAIPGEKFALDLRLIASTREDLSYLMSRRAFRQDLYFLINGITISVPPLRERKNDVLLLAHYYAEKLSANCDRPPLHFSDETLQVLQSYNWPGNLRELRGLIRRLVMTLEGDLVDISDLPPSLRFCYTTMGDAKMGARTLEEIEAEHIMNVLKSVEGNKSRAAEILGINRKTLWDKLKRYSLTDGH